MKLNEKELVKQFEKAFGSAKGRNRKVLSSVVVKALCYTVKRGHTINQTNNERRKAGRYIRL